MRRSNFFDRQIGTSVSTVLSVLLGRLLTGDVISSAWVPRGSGIGTALKRSWDFSRGFFRESSIVVQATSQGDEKVSMKKAMKKCYKGAILINEKMIDEKKKIKRNW